MSLIQVAGAYVISVFLFFALDMVWLGLVARNFYQRALADFLGPVNWFAAFTLYFLLLIGLMLFVIKPALERGDLIYALVWGALFGFFTYATYDLTNLATLKNWPLSVVFVDIVWGAVLSASVAGVTYVIASRFLM